MNVLYKRGVLLGIRYPYSIWGMLLRLVLLGLFVKISWVFAVAEIHWENWLIAVLFIVGIMLLGSNRKKAVYDSQTQRLVLYNVLFIPKRKKYDLPDLPDQLVFHTQQRIDNHRVNGVQKTLVFTDILLKTPRELIELDSIPLDHTLKEQGLSDWNKFFAAIYDPSVAEQIPARNAEVYLESACWILIVLCSGIAVFLNALSVHLH